LQLFFGGLNGIQNCRWLLRFARAFAPRDDWAECADAGLSGH